MSFKFFVLFFLSVFLSGIFLFGGGILQPVQALSLCQDPRADVNKDGIINVNDVAILANNFFKKPILQPEADINQDGEVNILDFHIIQYNVFKQCPSSTPSPTPSPTASVSPSPSSSLRPSASPVASPVPTPSPSPRPTPSPSPSLRPTPSPSSSPPVGYSVNSSGMISKNGQAFFPYGFYHITDVGNRYGTQLAQDVDTLGTAGFNVIQMSITWNNGLSDSAAARQKAKDKNMVIIASYYKPSLTQWLTGMKNDPVIMAWNTADDFNVPYSNPKNSPSAIKTINDQLLGAAQGIGYKTYTYGSGGGYPYQSGRIPFLLGDYKNSSMDFYGVQVYPIGNNDESFQGAPLEESLAYYRYARQQLPNKAILANTQTFAWPNNNGGCGQYPTVKEARNMLYGALAEGMNGILGYAYHDDCGIRARQADWQEQVSLRQEVNGDFLNAVVQGNRVVRDTADLSAKLPGRVHATFWTTTQNGKKASYVVVLNTKQSGTPTTASNVLELPDTWSTPKLTPLFSDTSRYPRTLSIVSANGKRYLNGDVGPQDVQVYKIEES